MWWALILLQGILPAGFVVAVGVLDGPVLARVGGRISGSGPVGAGLVTAWTVVRAARCPPAIGGPAFRCVP